MTRETVVGMFEVPGRLQKEGGRGGLQRALRAGQD